MIEQNSVQTYNEQDAICKRNIAILEPFLKRFSEEHDAGTCFYEDITILSGPASSEYNHFKNIYPSLFAGWQKGEVSVFNVKWAGLTFVMEYKLSHVGLFEYQGQVFRKPVYAPCSAFMLYEGKEYPVSLEIAKVVADLRNAQEYRGIIYGAHRDEIDMVMAMKKNEIVR